MPEKAVEATTNRNKSKNGKARPKKKKVDKENEVMLKSIRKVGSQDMLGNNHCHNDSLLEKRGDEPDHEIISLTSHKSKRTTNRCVCITVSGLLILIFCGAVVILVLLFLMVGERAPKVQTDCGFIEGDFDSATKSFSFKGIPYAQPPENVRRWHPSKPLSNSSCWSGVLKALYTPKQCAQKDPVTNRISGSEDCLYLNVYTPAIDPLRPASVMVYIHGGYLQWGNASTPGYSPDHNTAVSLGVVFVNIQYRLNAFGFLVTDAQSCNGNYGFLDQVAALKWIKNNIRKFSGDPDRITIFGQSSGATSVFALMTSPLATACHRLFSRAWMMSGSSVLHTPLEVARKQNGFILNHLNCSDEACLLRKSTEEILDAMYPKWDVLEQSTDLLTKEEHNPALAIVDGEFLPVAPFDAWDQRPIKYYSDVPLVVVTTAQMVGLSPAPGEDIKKWDYQDLNRYVDSRLSTFKEPNLTNRSLELCGISPDSREDEFDPERIFTTMASDIRVTCGNHRLATMASAALNSPVYRYVITGRPSRPAYALNIDFGATYAFHGWDVYQFLGTLSSIMSGKSDSDSDFSRTLQDSMLDFARSGEPRNSEWKQFPNTIALIGDTIRVNKTYNQQQCNMWKGEFLPVAPFDAWDQRPIKYYSDVPLVVGTTAQEVGLSPAPGEDIKKWDYQDLNRYVDSRLSTFKEPNLTNRSLELYGISPDSREDEFDPERIFTTMASDIRVTCGNHRLATMASAALNSPVYRYVITGRPSRPAYALNIDFGATYAFHGWDIYQFLGTLSSIMSGKSDSDSDFSRTLQDNMLDFARSGEPRNSEWKQFPNTIALIGDTIRVNKTYNQQQCNMWTGDAWFNHSWVN